MHALMQTNMPYGALVRAFNARADAEEYAIWRTGTQVKAFNAHADAEKYAIWRTGGAAD